MTKTKALAIAFLASSLLTAATEYKIVARYPVPGDGGFDYVTLDPASRRLYLSHGTQVDVLDADSGKVAGTIPGTPGVHGIAIAAAFKHGFITVGNENKVAMFDLATLQVIKKIDVGQRPDGIFYDAASKRIFTNNHGSHDMSVIDAATGDLVGSVELEGDAEQTLAGSDGMLYTNVEDTNEVAVFDPKSMKVVKRFPLGIAKTPTGLAYDAKTKRLFIATRNEPKMIVMDAVTGKVITSFPIGTGSDWADFDPDAKLIFVSTSEGLLNIFHQKSADVYEDAGALKTQQSAKTMAFDHKTKKIFLPAAEYDVTPATDPGKQPRRTVKPGSFVVLVVAK